MDFREQRSAASYKPSVLGGSQNLVSCPNRELNWQPLGAQDIVQPTEPHQSGLKV